MKIKNLLKLLLLFNFLNLKFLNLKSFRLLLLTLILTYSFQSYAFEISVGPSGDFQTIQSAIDSCCPGGINANETPPFIINIDPANGIYDEALTLNDVTLGRGDITGDTILQSSNPGELVHIALQLGINSFADGLVICQNEHNVTFKDILFYPSKNGNTFTNEVISIGEISSNTTSNTITFINCIVTEIDAITFAPLVTSKEEAIAKMPPTSVGSNRTGTVNLFKYYAEYGESFNLVLDNCVFFSNPFSAAVFINYGFSSNNTVTFNNCVVKGGGWSNIKVFCSGHNNFIVTGEDQTQGPMHCTYLSDPLAGHGIWFKAGGGLIDANISKAIIVGGGLGDPVTGDPASRGISGMLDANLILSDIIINVPGLCIVDGPANNATYDRLTLHSPSCAYYGVGGYGSITMRDCIISGQGTKFNGSVGYEVPTNGINIDNCAIVEQGPYAIDARVRSGISGITFGPNVITNDPRYLNVDNPLENSFMDVSSRAYRQKATGNNNLSGGANWIYSNIIFVPQDFLTIQSAIDEAFDGDTIIVSEGTYVENINLKGKNVILSSTDPTNPDIVARTTIDGNLIAPVVIFNGTEDENCKIIGFTITNGKALSQNNLGGGIKGDGTMATIQYNRIIGNYDSGIYDCDGMIQNNLINKNTGRDYWDSFCGIYDCNGLIQNNVITENNGSGLQSCNGIIQYNNISGNTASGLYNCNGIIQYNNISGNVWEEYTADIFGGGLSKCNGTIQYNTISGNLGQSGGGLYKCDGGIIRNNTISGNWAKGGGGLANCNNIENNIIVNNWAYFCISSGVDGGGGLLKCYNIINNIICGNTANYFGGGLCSCSGVIQNNLIYRNWADFGGGVATYYQNYFLQNNTIYANYAYYSGGGIYEGYERNDAKIQNCIIWQNSSPDNAQISLTDYEPTLPEYCCIQEWTLGGTGNITDDPQFVDPDGADDDFATYQDNDFHLKSTSPCIDAGMYIEGLTQDFEGQQRGFNGTSEPRGDGSDYDIGADEFIGPTYVHNWSLWE